MASPVRTLSPTKRHCPDPGLPSETIPQELCCGEGTSCFTALVHHNNMIPDFARIDTMFAEVLKHVKKTDQNTEEMKKSTEEMKKDLRIIRSRVEVMEANIDTLQDDVTVIKDDMTVVKEEVSLVKIDVVIMKRDVRDVKEHTAFIKRKMD